MTQPNPFDKLSGYVEFGGVRIHLNQPTAPPSPEEHEVAVRDLSTADLKMVQDQLLDRLNDVKEELERRKAS